MQLVWLRTVRKSDCSRKYSSDSIESCCESYNFGCPLYFPLWTIHLVKILYLKTSKTHRTLCYTSEVLLHVNPNEKSLGHQQKLKCNSIYTVLTKRVQTGENTCCELDISFCNHLNIRPRKRWIQIIVLCDVHTNALPRRLTPILRRQLAQHELL